MGIFTVFTADNIPSIRLLHFLCQRIPSSQIIPFTAVGNTNNRIQLFNNLIIKAVLFYRLIFLIKQVERNYSYFLFNQLSDKASLKNKYASIPQSALCK